MRSKKMTIEIALISIAGLITLYISITSIIKADKQEAELKESQRKSDEKSDSIISLQRDMQRKSDQIIELQNQLISTSTTQLDIITKLRNPIPKEVQISFTSKIIQSTQEYGQTLEALTLVRGNRGNTLPTEFTISNDGTNRIEKLKDILFTLNIMLIQDGKELTFSLRRIPTYFGFHPTNLINNCFLLAIMQDKNYLEFDGFTLVTSEIACSYTPASILDFKNAKVKISYSFSYPTFLTPGDLMQKGYITTDKEYMKIELFDVKIHTRDLKINLDNLNKVDDFNFETTYQWSEN